LKSITKSILPISGYLILTFFTLITLLPFLWVVIGSLKTSQSIMVDPFALPDTYQFSNYTNAFIDGDLGKLFINTIIVSLISVFVCLLIATMTSYAVIRGGKFAGLMYSLIIIGIFLPLNSLMVPYFMIVSKLNLLNTLWALITTYTAVGLPFSVLLIYSFLKTLHKELFESAEIDGAGFVKIYTSIVIPLVRPALATAAIFQFLLSWNEFIYALLLTTDNSVRTLQVGISLFKTQFQSDYGLLFAGVVMSVVPVVIIYILLQRLIISGLTAGSVKG
jgi:raffinose/stachyose/melibiose transport system permease protein